MKKIILSFCFLATFVATQAQTTYGPMIGINFSNYTGKSGGVTQSTDMKIGGRIGGIVDFGLSDNISLQPGIFYVMNGYKTSVLGIDVSASVNTIEVPINVEYKFGTPGGNRFFVGIGPYVGMNIGGTIKVSGSFLGVSVSDSKSIRIGSDTSSADMKALDMGLGLNVGYQLSQGWIVKAHYQMGFMNLMPSGDENNSMKNYNFGVSVGYLFGDKTKKDKKDEGKKK